jgi:3'-phosphoadenosine 5'-phosphosulfate (PAPS) 3'-phosphatase
MRYWRQLIREILKGYRVDVGRFSIGSILCLQFDALGLWVLDPVDGTKGYLRGERYAVCLSLIIDARVELGVIGCPNLPVDPLKPDGKKGALFVAVRGRLFRQRRRLTCCSRRRCREDRRT